MAAAPDPLELCQCPYNKSHQIQHYKMHIHLAKCRRSMPDCKKTTCPFDCTHIVNEVELDYHVSVCSKRFNLDKQLYVLDDDFKPPVEIVASEPAPCDEDWENTNTSYVADTSKKNHIIKKPRGLTPSERRKIRMEGIKTYRSPESTD